MEKKKKEIRNLEIYYIAVIISAILVLIIPFYLLEASPAVKNMEEDMTKQIVYILVPINVTVWGLFNIAFFFLSNRLIEILDKAKSKVDYRFFQFIRSLYYLIGFFNLLAIFSTFISFFSILKFRNNFCISLSISVTLALVVAYFSTVLYVLVLEFRLVESKEKSNHVNT